jgi:hypothetical protein
MPSTYTVNLGIEKPATGEQSGTWGDTTNVNFDILDQAINGAVVLTLANPGTSGTPNLLEISNGSTSDGRNKWIELTDAGDLGGTSYLRLDPNDAARTAPATILKYLLDAMWSLSLTVTAPRPPLLMCTTSCGLPR